MKFSVGYQFFGTDDYINEIIKRKDKISEVFFSWGGYANGRNNILNQDGFAPWDVQRKQHEDMKKLSSEKIKLNLLFNAACYGRESQSRAFFTGIGNTVDFILREFGLASVATSSLLIAKFIKTNFPALDIRASVNMGVGTPEGIDYVSDYFDSFYIKRELNRDFSAIKKLKDFCDKNGKELYALANSGCLNNCSAHAFHDNLVAHEDEISKMDNGYNFSGVCREYLKTPQKRISLLKDTNFIRPEDIHLYEGLFPAMKLATRVNKNPLQILKAYMDKKSHSGSILELLEPDNGGVIYPYILENSKIGSFVSGDKLVYDNFENALIKINLDGVII